jgi:hypothetical protein
MRLKRQDHPKHVEHVQPRRKQQLHQDHLGLGQSSYSLMLALPDTFASLL